MITNEAELLTQILKYLKEKGILAFRIPLGPVLHGGIKKKNPLKGFPDIMGFMPNTKGRAFTIECKIDKAKLSDDQLEMEEKLYKAGVLTITARKLDDVMDYFDDHPRIYK